MAPNPVCPAVAAAKEKTGLSYAQIAKKIGEPEDQVIAMCSTSNSPPNYSSVQALAGALEIKDPLPQNSVHGC